MESLAEDLQRSLAEGNAFKVQSAVRSAVARLKEQSEKAGDDGSKGRFLLRTTTETPLSSEFATALLCFGDVMDLIADVATLPATMLLDISRKLLSVVRPPVTEPEKSILQTFLEMATRRSVHSKLFSELLCVLRTTPSSSSSSSSSLEEKGEEEEEEREEGDGKREGAEEAGEGEQREREKERERRERIGREAERSERKAEVRERVNSWIGVSGKAANALGLDCPRTALYEEFIRSFIASSTSLLDGTDRASADLFLVVFEKLSVYGLGTKLMEKLIEGCLRRQLDVNSCLLPLFRSVLWSSVRKLLSCTVDAIATVRSSRANWSASLFSKRDGSAEKRGEESEKEREGQQSPSREASKPRFRAVLLGRILEKVLRSDQHRKEFASMIASERMTPRMCRLCVRGVLLLKEVNSDEAVEGRTREESVESLLLLMFEYALQPFSSAAAMRETPESEWQALCLFLRMAIKALGEKARKHTSLLLEGVQMHLGSSKATIRRLGMSVAGAYAAAATPECELSFGRSPENAVEEGSESDGSSVEDEAEDREKAVENEEREEWNTAVQGEPHGGDIISVDDMIAAAEEGENDRGTEGERESDTDSISSFEDYEYESNDGSDGEGETDILKEKLPRPRSLLHSLELLHDGKTSAAAKLAVLKEIPSLSMKANNLTSSSGLWQSTSDHFDRPDSKHKLVYSLTKAVLRADLAVPESEEPERIRMEALASLVGKEAFVEAALAHCREVLRTKDESLLAKSIVLTALRKGAEEFASKAAKEQEEERESQQQSLTAAPSSREIGTVKWRSRRLMNKPEKLQWVNQFGLVAPAFFKCATCPLLNDSDARALILRKDTFLLAEIIETASYFVMLADHTACVRAIVEECAELIDALSAHPDAVVRRSLVKAAMRVVFVAQSSFLIETSETVQQLITAISSWIGDLRTSSTDQDLLSQCEKLEAVMSSVQLEGQLQSLIAESGSQFSHLSLLRS